MLRDILKTYDTIIWRIIEGFLLMQFWIFYLNHTVFLALRPPGFAPEVALTLVPTNSIPATKNQVANDLGIDFNGILWGTPVHKTTKPRKMIRKHAVHYTLRPPQNLIPCTKCGSWHLKHTICGFCYKKVKEATEQIKEQLLKYNPFAGELQDRETEVLFKNDPRPTGGEQNLRILEIPKERPEWFSKDLKKRWKFLKD